MSVYCQVEDLSIYYSPEQLAQLTSDNGIPAVDNVVFSKTVQNAGAVIDGYLGGLYTLPLTVVPELIKSIATDLVAYDLWVRRGQDAPEWLSKKSENAHKLLQQIQMGKVKLGISVNDTPPGSFVLTNKKSGNKLFSRDVLGGF